MADAVPGAGPVEGTTEPVAYAREMGVDHRDFFRLLPRAMGEHAYTVDGTTVDARVGGGVLRIEVGEEQMRRIALLALPFARVSFTFTGTSESERDAFTRRFELAFRRGGG